MGISQVSDRQVRQESKKPRKKKEQEESKELDSGFSLLAFSSSQAFQKQGWDWLD